MGKELIQDIKQPKRRLAEILPRPARAPSESVVYPTPRSTSGGARRHRGLIWFFVLLIIFGLPLAYFGSQFFARAQVIVTPKKATLELNQTLQLSFETMTVQTTEQTIVAVSGKQMVAERASGQILITNRYSTRPQRLVAKTRFAAPDGRIYRISQEVIVPGYTLVDGKVVDGQIEVKIEADKPGAEYNGEIKTLTIPGFKGDPKFDKITAQTVAPLAHGFAGERAVVSPADRDVAEKELTTRLRVALEAEAVASLPDGFFTFESGKFFKSQSQTRNGVASTSNLTLEMNGELTAIIFSERNMSRQLATLGLKDYDDAEVMITNFDQLKFDLLSSETFDPATAKQATIKITGRAELVWQFDVSALKKALAGVSQDDYQNVFLKFPSLVEAKPVIQPPWLNRFPSDPAKIEVVIVGVDH